MGETIVNSASTTTSAATGSRSALFASTRSEASSAGVRGLTIDPEVSSIQTSSSSFEASSDVTSSLADAGVAFDDEGAALEGEAVA